MPFYPNGSTIGADFNNSSTTSQFALMTKALGSNDTQWVYVYMSGSAIAGDCVAISQTGTAARATIALAMTPAKEIAFAQSTFADGEYGWVCRGGLGISVGMSATTAAVTTALYIGVTSAGKLSTTAGSATVYGVQVAGSSANATAWVATGTVTWPRIGDANLSNS
jgi:hypothetical protein